MLKNIKIAILLCLFSSIQVKAESSVWRISRGDDYLFLGGTIHVLSKRDFPLPEEYYYAYSQSGTVVFETDIEGTLSPAFQQKMISHLSYPQGQRLSDDLAPETYHKLLEYSSRSGLPMMVLDKLKPQMVAITLTVSELRRLGLAEAGVDEYFFKRAIEDDKPVGQLETLEQQLDIMLSMGDGYEDELILNAIDDLEELPDIMQKMKKAWRTGKLVELENLALKEMMEKYPGLFDTLLRKRNAAWLPQINAMLTTRDVEFVLVGALHLVSEHGVLEMLRQQGHQVDKVQIQ